MMIIPFTNIHVGQFFASYVITSVTVPDRIDVNQFLTYIVITSVAVSPTTGAMLSDVSVLAVSASHSPM